MGGVSSDAVEKKTGQPWESWWRNAIGAAKDGLAPEVAALASEQSAYLAKAIVRNPAGAWRSMLDGGERPGQARGSAVRSGSAGPTGVALAESPWS